MPNVHRVEVAPAPGRPDPVADAIRKEAMAVGVSLSHAAATHVYLIQPHAQEPLGAAEIERVRTCLLADPVTESSSLGAAPLRVGGGGAVVEVHPLPGVMDPVAESVQAAIKDLLGLKHEPQVTTGWRYDLGGISREQSRSLANRLLANPVIQKVHVEPYQPAVFPVSQAHAGEVRSVPLINLSQAELEKLSRDAHLFLSLDEMKAVQDHYRSIGRDPREIELETLAQTWSEHCVHKTLKSHVLYKSGGKDPVIDWTNRPGHTVQADGSVVINNLLKSTVAAATHRLIAEGLDWTLSVFVDNAGVIAFDDKWAINVKVETHNHPSAIEPYGGAATGVGGCIRDVIATGLGAMPIANTDVFCVAHPGLERVPEGCLSPRRILMQVVAGVRDYGNRMGIPTVNGAVYFDDRYVGNPLVYCGCIGLMPRDCVKGQVHKGDLIVALGGRTGRDGIHGATFSSAELEHTATDEFAHAVQIGNAITEKRVLDAIMRARDGAGGPLYSGLTDCGAGGFSSAVGEMGKETGATVHLDRAPLKYAGLSPTEIWISEAQERMVLAVPPKNLAKLQAICDEESVELAVLGDFGPPKGSTGGEPDLCLMFHGREVGRMSMHLLHEGIPTPRREAEWRPPVCAVKPSAESSRPAANGKLTEMLLALLAHPNIASKHWIIRQYDHEVKGGTTVKPLGGPLGRGPMDAAVLRPVPTSAKGLAIACGLQTGMGDPAIGGDPYLMTLAAIDECVRNLVCVGADPERIAILDNFCWPSCRKPENLATLVRAAEACYDGAIAYRTPFVSGKDSLNNQFTTKDGRTIEIPPTLLITGISVVGDVARCVTMDAKLAGNLLVMVGATSNAMGGSHVQQMFGLPAGASGEVPRTDLKAGPATGRAVASMIANGLVASAHDVSDGGVLTAVAEMLIGGSSPRRPIGAVLEMTDPSAAFGEGPSRYLLEVPEADVQKIRELAGQSVPVSVIGRLDGSGDLKFGGESIAVESLAAAWLRPLDW